MTSIVIAYQGYTMYKYEPGMHEMWRRDAMHTCLIDHSTARELRECVKPYAKALNP